MDTATLRRLIETAAGRVPADVVIKNGTIADVYTGRFFEADIAVCGEYIAGIGTYHGKSEVDARGLYILPGLIDSHIHVESSHLSPEELGRVLVPYGTSTIIADPHEIVNVAGLAGLEYMLAASEKTALDIIIALPSCVPATPFETSGAKLDAAALREPLADKRVIGLGEFMDYVGVINADDAVLDKLLAAKAAGKLIDGHSPSLAGNGLNAYIAAGIATDHECATVEEALDRASRGMYVQIRQGSACHDLPRLLPALTPENERRFLFCSDDRQPKTIFEDGHIDCHLRMAVQAGLSPASAIRLATLNAAECYRLYDRGGIAPGLRADLTLVNDLRSFRARKVFIKGRLTAADGEYLLPVERHDDGAVRGSFNVKDFSRDKLRLTLKSGDVFVIEISPGSIVTGKKKASVKRDASGDFVFDAEKGITKIAVVERYAGTGQVAVALQRGFGLRSGAIALSIAHDSHNIIAVGASDDDMFRAVERLLELSGGVVFVEGGAVKAELPLPLGGLMSDQNAAWVEERVSAVHAAARAAGVPAGIDPITTLCFMSLPVIPELKLTARGLFDVNAGRFIGVEV